MSVFVILEIVRAHGSWPKGYSWKLLSTHPTYGRIQGISMSSFSRHQNVYCRATYNWG